MWILVKVVDPIGIKERDAALDAMDLEPFRQQEFCEIGPILAG